MLRFVSVLFLFCLTIDTQSQDSRRILFNSDWKFHKGEVGFQSTIDDAQWRTVELPHDWSVEGPFSDEWASGTGYLPGGIGWYRKKFTIPDEYSGKQIYIYFDGVYKNSEVWLNEKYLGKRPNGYASFYYDITSFLKQGENVIAVKVDHTDFGDSRWYTGSGINRNVYLIPTDPVHLALWGVSFTTPSVTTKEAAVNLKLSIKNTSGQAESIVLTSELLSSEGKVVSVAKKDVVVPPTGIEESLDFKVKKPLLWSPKSPNLYQLRTSLSRNGKTTDVVVEQVGFRSFTFDPNKGFILNGESIKMKGVCFHDDAGALGSAVPRAAWERRLRTLKDLGCNAIRMSHNPHQDYLYDLCDEMGFLVQDEAFDEWEIGKNKWIAGWNVGTPGKDGYSKYFKEWAEADIRDMIMRNRNRASIVMWSIGNEIDYPNDPYTHEVLSTGKNPQIYGRGYEAGYPPAERLGVIAKELVSFVKKYDTTRPVTAALAGVVMSNTTTYPEELDVVGYNYQEYRYQDDHAKYPSRVIYGSENSKSWEAWNAVKENDFISGQFLWTAFDFIGEARAWPIRSSGAGMIDMAGFPKHDYFHRQAMWLEKPVIHIASARIEKSDGASSSRRYQPLQSHWNWSAGDSVTLQCYSNLEEAELVLNGKSLGRKKLSPDLTLKWKMIYEPGELVAKGYKNGKVIGEMKLTTTESPSKLFAKAYKDVIHVNPDDVGQIEIFIQDKNGRIVGNASDLVTVTVDGPGRLIGMESGSLNSHEDYKANSRQAVSGKLVAFVKADAKGKIKVTVSGANLSSYDISLLSE